MIAVVAILRAKPGMTDEFERLFTDLAAQVRANEGGNITYQLCRSRTEPATYKVLELYRDEAALEAHRASDHFRAAGPGLGRVLEGRPEIELLDAVG
ncbi:putative quinol monooxygenase [Novosphingobium sp. Gsoil 351]|uniref:putative quinol monooxygenase n=1 Tax=Novosphingobium sp. Gsoil 351 TaxID=2675225 RepID=UPI0012B45A4D|nr:putative quinol monooxygenase [Novosphingobium sp. Gsoil 351]QGN54966.1 antibiotic biosynthesis monooxygenase [Novosphingobium sp. Gsoil 351]